MRYLAAPLVALLLAALVGTAQQPPAPPDSRTVEGKAGAVACVSPAAADVGAATLRRGGTAVDAAVAVGFALAVSWPEAGNIGGGGFMLVHPKNAAPAFFDYRETAPAAATPTMFADRIDWTSAKTAGVPGSVRGLALAHRRFGKLPWADVVRPAVKLAAEGFAVTPALAGSLNRVLADTRVTDAEFRRVFARPKGGEWKAGDTLTQPDLAATLTAIAESGADAFYTGELADKLAATMSAAGGIMTAADLAGYAAKERAPVVGRYRGVTVVTAPPPSSGGLVLLSILGQLERFDLAVSPRDSARTAHLLSEAMRRAYRDRAAGLGDPDFSPVPKELFTPERARRLAETIDPDCATPSLSLLGGIPFTPAPAESDQTTHYSVADSSGMAVSTTTTLENSFGCRVVVRGAGYILNNEMTDFNHRPGVTDAAGRIGTPPNVAAPGKRMLSSMCPTILARGGVPVLVTGSPGGRTIPNTVACVVVNAIDYKMTPRQMVDAPRSHHQWFPDELSVEPLPAETLAEFAAAGAQTRGAQAGRRAHNCDRPGDGRRDGGRGRAAGRGGAGGVESRRCLVLGRCR